MILTFFKRKNAILKIGVRISATTLKLISITFVELKKRNHENIERIRMDLLFIDNNFSIDLDVELKNE